MAGGPSVLYRPIRFPGFALVFFALIASMAMIAPGARSQSTSPPSSPAKSVAIVLLGTGTPVPNADRQGPSLAIVANGKAYLVDAGSGVVRQANSAFQRGIPALQPHELDIAFLTHLHSDHTLGLPDLILTPWIQERTKPLQLYGPAGTKAMAGHILEAYAEDIQVRTTGLEGGNTTGNKVEAHDIEPGTIYHDENVTVKAFLVKHGSWKEALGYRFDADGKSVVVSGDTSPAESVINACNGCDALIHEVYAGRGVNPAKASLSVEQWMKYESEFHTSAPELGEIAARAKARMLILTHWTLLGNAKEEDLLRELRQKYSGPIVIARDLDVVVP
jgi:ribonuclease BN (tRNA processing enzyme)